MSIGIGGNAKKICEDNENILYEYGGYNLNDPQYSNHNHIYDGTITIRKDCLVEPEIHQKLKKQPSGKKKLITNRILVNVPFEELFSNGSILVENCSNCWAMLDRIKIDIVAYRIIHILFDEYQKDGEVPDMVSYHV